MYHFSDHVFLYLFYLNTHKSRTNSYCVTLSLIELLSIPLKSGAKHVNVTNRPRRSKFFRHHQTHTHTHSSARLRLQSGAKGGGPLDTVPLDKVLFIQLVRKHGSSASLYTRTYTHIGEHTSVWTFCCARGYDNSVEKPRDICPTDINSETGGRSPSFESA